ncbi:MULTISPECIES: plasminogen-binding N-terminal domain-containing protein [Sulfurimonas]|uniref:plasminogen-binding N-terminal domain-containing protein n=1 Tax=Sulfurimonas TaxID=202746 RepID=UPI0012654496|nr:plasminogen-binding N-terminal domain-containing protein [Sulfurimonas indica]
MKYTILLILMVSQMMAAVMKAPILTVDNDKALATIEIDHIDVGVSGFVVHHITPEHSVILKNATVMAYDKAKKIATIKMSEFNALRNNSLPYGKYKPEVGDTVELAFGYSRALLIAPTEEIYHQISKSVRIQWIHPDLFATVLSFAGHPTPLQEDFTSFANAASVGLLFIYLDKKVYTVDIKSFTILNITDASFEAKKKQTPFYTRVTKIDAAWWGEGSDEMENYAPHYYKLLVQNNKKNKALYEIVKSHKELVDLVTEFKIGK